MINNYNRSVHIDSDFANFDDDFPFPKEVEQKQHEQKQKYILDLIRSIYENPEWLYLPEFLKKENLKNLFNFDPMELNKICKIYEKKKRKIR